MIKMKKGSLITIVVVVAVLLIGIFWGVGVYNGLVNKQEQVNNSWSQVENQYQRRADLIPNLVETVKGYATHERETLEGVIEARSKATSTNIDANNLDEAAMAKFQQSQDALSSALSRLMVVVERYPDLKANENFKQLQAQLEGTENRIAVARKDFNDTARVYNTSVRNFPTNIVAGVTGFKKRPYFEARQGADVAPQVKF